jgi:hypothetical protein
MVPFVSSLDLVTSSTREDCKVRCCRVQIGKSRPGSQFQTKVRKNVANEIK